MQDMTDKPEDISSQLPEEPPKMEALAHEDPVARATETETGVQAAAEMTGGRVVEGEMLPKPKSSLKVLVPILAIMVVAAIWGFMPMPLNADLAKLGTVTDKGAYHEIHYKGDSYGAEQELQKIFPELIAEKAKPKEGDNEVAVYTDGKHFIDVVGLQGKEPAYIRVMKRKNLSRF